MDGGRVEGGADGDGGGVEHGGGAGDLDHFGRGPEGQGQAESSDSADGNKGLGLRGGKRRRGGAEPVGGRGERGEAEQAGVVGVNGQGETGGGVGQLDGRAGDGLARGIEQGAFDGAAVGGLRARGERCGGGGPGEEQGGSEGAAVPGARGQQA